MATISNSLNVSAFSPAQAKAIIALAEGYSVGTVAAHASVSPSTISDWMLLPDFSHAVYIARQAHDAFIQERMDCIARLALDTLEKILTDPKASPSVRLKAALAVLDRDIFSKECLQSAPADPAILPEVVQLAKTIKDAAATPASQPDSPARPVEIPRNAPCPCGSGNKYKRCCGTNAPPQLSQAA